MWVPRMTSTRACPGPSHPCMRSVVLFPSGMARHYGDVVPCVGGCGRDVSLARYVPDARRDPVTGDPMGGHLCTRCDPMWTTARGGIA